MKLWISKNSEVPVHDQLVAQITLGIASKDLAPGERLPSTRELARRFQVHQNTVSMAYRELAAHGLVTLKRGSGVYVAEAIGSNRRSETIEDLFAQFLENSARLGYPRSDILNVINEALIEKQTSRFLVVESDQGLREIIVSEIEDATGVSTVGVPIEELEPKRIDGETKIVAMSDERSKLDPILGIDGRCTFLEPNSVPGAMQGQARPSDDDLIVVVSGWEQFVTLARLFLLAADIDPETVITRSTRDADWRKATSHAAMIICDSLTVNNFSEDSRVRVFPLIARDSLDALRRSVGK